MRRRIALILMFLAVVLLLGGPVFEHFDHWDGFPQSGQDFLLSVIAVLVCPAAAVSFVRQLLRLTAGRTNLPPQAVSPHRTQLRECPAYFDSAGLQPLSLRI